MNVLKILFFMLPITLCAADTAADETGANCFDLLPNELIDLIIQDVWNKPSGFADLRSFSLTCKRLSECAQGFVNNDSTIASCAIRYRTVAGCQFVQRGTHGILQFSREEQQYVPKICAAISLDARIWFKKNVLEKNIKCTHLAPAFPDLNGAPPVTFLHWIAGCNAENIASLVIKDCDKGNYHDGDLWESKSLNEQGQSPFDYALNHKADKVILLLLKKNPAFLESDKKSRFGECLHIAVSKKNAMLIRWLVDNRGDGDINEERNDYARETALGTAAHFGGLNIVRLLVENGSNVNSCDHVKRTPLHKAARCIDLMYPLRNASDQKKKAYKHSCLEKVVYLIGKGADINARTQAGETALDIAKSVDNQEMVAFLEQYAKGHQN